MELKFNDSLGGRNRLCLAFILYNEGESIEKAIKAFWYRGIPIYDYLVIGIDNKTTDDTEKIVQKYCLPDNLFHFDFNDDFAESRNKVLRLVEKTDADWVMFPDGHEVLRPESLDAVKFFVEEKKGGEIWLLSPYIEIDVDEYDIPDVVFPRPIFFRNKKGLFFERKVHNYLDAPDNRKASVPEVRFIHNMPHERKRKRVTQRQEMNLPELIKNVEAGDIRDLFFLGNTYFETENNKKAVKIYSKLMDRIHLKDTDMAAQAAITQALAYAKMGDHNETIKSCLMAIANRWDRAEPYFCLGYASSKKAGAPDLDGQRKYHLLKEAEHWFQIATTLCMPVSIYFLQGKQYTWYPWDALVDIKNKLGDIEGSLKAAEKVLEFKKDDPISLENIRQLKKRMEENKGVRSAVQEEAIGKDSDPFM